MHVNLRSVRYLNPPEGFDGLEGDEKYEALVSRRGVHSEQKEHSESEELYSSSAIFYAQHYTISIYSVHQIVG